MILSTILWILYGIMIFSIIIREILKYFKKDKINYDVVYKVSPLIFFLSIYFLFGTVVSYILGLIMSFNDLESYIMLIIVSLFAFYPLLFLRFCNCKVAIKEEDIFVRKFSKDIQIRVSDIKYIKKSFFNTYIMFDNNFKELFRVRYKSASGIALYELILLKSNPISASLGVNTIYYEDNNSSKELSKDFVIQRKKVKKERYIFYAILIVIAIFCFITFFQEGFIFPMLFFPCFFSAIIIIIEIICRKKEKELRKTNDFQFGFSRKINYLSKIKTNFGVKICIGIYFFLVSLPIIATSNDIVRVDYNYLNKVETIAGCVIKNEPYSDVSIIANDGTRFLIDDNYLEYINYDLLSYIKENDKITVLAEKTNNYTNDGTIEYDIHYLKVNDKVVLGKLQLDSYIHDQKVDGSRTKFFTLCADIAIVSLMYLSYKRYKKLLSKELNNSNEKVSKISICISKKENE